MGPTKESVIFSKRRLSTSYTVTGERWHMLGMRVARDSGTGDLQGQGQLFQATLVLTGDLRGTGSPHSTLLA
jgi:hypothetical protein